MLDRIKKIVQNECGREITEDEELIWSGKLKSIQIYTIVCILEEEFEIRFLPEEIGNPENFSTVTAMGRLVKQKCEKK